MRKIIGLIVGGIIGTIAGCLVNYFCIEWVCDLANCFVSAGGRHSDTGVSSSTVCTIFVIICAIAGIIIGFIIGKSADEEAIWEQEKQEEQRQKFVKYLEGLNYNTVISNCIREYLKTRHLSNDYYQNISYTYHKSYYSWFDKCYTRTNQKEVEKIVRRYKEILFHNVCYSVNCTDYKINSATIKEVYIGDIEASWATGQNCVKGASVYIDEFDRVSIQEHGSDYCDCIPVLKKHGFVISECDYDRYISDELIVHVNRKYHVYAYIKL